MSIMKLSSTNTWKEEGNTTHETPAGRHSRLKKGPSIQNNVSTLKEAKPRGRPWLGSQGDGTARTDILLFKPTRKNKKRDEAKHMQDHQRAMGQGIKRKRQLKEGVRGPGPGQGAARRLARGTKDNNNE